MSMLAPALGVWYCVRMEIRDTRNGEWHWVYNALLADPHLFANDKLVYSAISTFGGHQVIHPTIEQIAERCGVSERGVQLSLNKLEEVGYIEMEKSTGRGNANVYYLLKKQKGCNHCTLSKGRNEQQKRVQPSAIKGAAIAPHIDTHINKKDTAKADFASKGEEPTRVVVGEEGESRPKRDIGAQREYEEMIRWLEGVTGVKIIYRSKQFKHLSVARVEGISKTRLKNRAKELLGEPFFQEHGMDWGNVVTSFNKRA